jgi:uncharacterized membrane protein YesL
MSGSWQDSAIAFAFSRVWDRLGTILWVGFLGSVAAFTILLFPPALAAAAESGVRAVQSQDFGLRDFFAAGRRYFFRSWALFLTLAAASLMILFNLRFYAAQEGLLWTLPLSLTLGLALALAIIAPFLYPVMVRDDLGLRETLRHSLAAAGRRPATSVLSTLIISVFAFLLGFTTVGLLLLWPALLFFPASMLEKPEPAER